MKDQATCDAFNQVYKYDPVSKKGTLNRKEDIGLIKMLIPVVGWDPLDWSDKRYWSPIIKYEFFQGWKSMSCGHCQKLCLHEQAGS